MSAPRPIGWRITDWMISAPISPARHSEDWAGPVKVALGVEYRLAGLNVTTTTPDNSFNPQYLRLAPPGTFAPTAASPTGIFPPANLGNFKEVQSGAQGSEDVSEADIEFDAPLLRDLPGVALLSFNGAARYTAYDVGGCEPDRQRHGQGAFLRLTWKLGADWLVADDLKLHVTRSRDIRAPTLWDLFQGPVTSTSGISDSLTGASGSANTLTVGNPALKPEVANNNTGGLIYTPGWLAQSQRQHRLFPHSGATRDRRRFRQQSGGAVAVPGVAGRHIALLRADPAADFLQQHLAAEFSRPYSTPRRRTSSASGPKGWISTSVITAISAPGPALAGG